MNVLFSPGPSSWNSPFICSNVDWWPSETESELLFSFLSVLLEIGHTIPWILWLPLYLLLHVLGAPPPFFLSFLGLYPWHMEVPKLGVELELQLPASTTAHNNAESLTHWARPRIEPSSSWILVRFVTAEPRQELPRSCLLKWLPAKGWRGGGLWVLHL